MRHSAQWKIISLRGSDMKIIETKVYKLDELSEEAKKKAREWYREGNDMPFLEDNLKELLENELAAAGYTFDDSLELHYSLTCSQGDGASFTGTLEKDGETYKVTKGHQYEHEMMMSIEREDAEGGLHDAPEVLEELRGIARKIEKAGYAEIDAENEDENVDENIRTNEYTFTESGKRFG